MIIQVTGTIVFTGGAYYLVPNLKLGESDFTINSGFKWIKSQKKFSNRFKLFACPKHAQIVSKKEFNKIIS